MLAKYIFIAAAAAVGAMGATTCAAQAQFASCKNTMQPYIDNCGAQDAQCLCRTHRDLLAQCYPLCPEDAGKAGEMATISAWCVGAGGDKTSTTPVATPTATSSSSGSSESPVASGSDTVVAPTGTKSSSPSGTESATTSAPSSESTGSSGNVLTPAGFMVAAAAAMGLVL